MRAVKRLRSLELRQWVLPVILAALAARAFMPAGFMSMAGDRTMTFAMCSPDKSRRERLEIPGDPVPGQHRGMECQHCLAPVLGTPIAFLRVDSAPEWTLVPREEAAQRPWLPLPRAQTARAPPHA